MIVQACLLCHVGHHLLELLEIQEAIFILVHSLNEVKPGVIVEFTKDLSKIFDGDLPMRFFVEEVESFSEFLIWMRVISAWAEKGGGLPLIDVNEAIFVTIHRLHNLV